MANDVEELLQPFFRKIMRRDKIGAEEQAAIVAAAAERLDLLPR